MYNEQYSSNSDGTYRYTAGRVEICQNGAYRSLCDAGWDDEDARVLCLNQYSTDFSKWSIVQLIVSLFHYIEIVQTHHHRHPTATRPSAMTFAPLPLYVVTLFMQTLLLPEAHSRE